MAEELKNGETEYAVFRVAYRSRIWRKTVPTLQAAVDYATRCAEDDAAHNVPNEYIVAQVTPLMRVTAEGRK